VLHVAARGVELPRQGVQVSGQKVLGRHTPGAPLARAARLPLLLRPAAADADARRRGVRRGRVLRELWQRRALPHVLASGEVGGRRRRGRRDELLLLLVDLLQVQLLQVGQAARRKQLHRLQLLAHRHGLCQRLCARRGVLPHCAAVDAVAARHCAARRRLLAGGGRSGRSGGRRTHQHSRLHPAASLATR
jgi:hypothetical protein